MPLLNLTRLRVLTLFILLVVGWTGKSVCLAKATSTPIDSLESIISRMEIPKCKYTDEILVYTGFVVSYNTETLIPNWVAYELTIEETEGEISRNGSFGMDLSYTNRQAMREDYSYSGWDKGHMAPAADMKWSQEAMWESFYLTNVCPQDHDLNGGDWLRLENKVRDWARKHGTIYVVCGPIIGTKKYGDIRNNCVAVPDAFFKAMLITLGDTFYSIAFYMNNEGTRHSLRSYARTVNEIEEISGLDLFPNIPDEIEEMIEGTFSIDLWGL